MNESATSTQPDLPAMAAAIFANRGVDFATARRAGGWTNATWLAGGLALRLAVKPGTDKLRREARLSAFFPPEVGYPPILETGVTEGCEWSLSQEIMGRSLGEVWPRLTWAERVAALRQLWQRCAAVHSVAGAAAGLARRQAWFNNTNPETAEAAISHLTRQGFFGPAQTEVLRAALERFWQALPAAACVLNHGDLTLDNALWHAGQVVALLDFEFAVMAPLELDLNGWVKMAFAPAQWHTQPPDADGVGLPDLRAAVMEIAWPLIDRAGSWDRLLGYAILLELWLFTDWLEHPEGEGPVETWAPYLALLSLADGKGGYLAPLMASSAATGARTP